MLIFEFMFFKDSSSCKLESNNLIFFNINFLNSDSNIKSLNILVIGAGMYVSGRGTSGFGTILPALSEWKRNSSISEINISCAATSHSSVNALIEKANKLSNLTKVDLDISIYPNKNQVSEKPYLDALKAMKHPACSIIVVPDHLHFQVTKDCLDAGVHPLVVKPLTPTYKESKELCKIAADKNLYGAVEFHKRWDKSNLILRDKIFGGDLGDPLYSLVEYSQRKSVPTSFFKQWAAETNILQYLGIHYIDLMRFISGAVPLRVLASGQKNLLANKKIDTYDSIQCLIEWEMPNKKIFNQTILTNWIDPETSSAMSDQSLKVIGTKGRYEADQKNRGIMLNTDLTGIEHINPDFCFPITHNDGITKWQGYGIDSIVSFLNDVTEIESGKSSISDFELIRPTFSESLISSAIIDYANKSLQRGGVWQSIVFDDEDLGS
jgi:predicted dehydrogenase